MSWSTVLEPTESQLSGGDAECPLGSVTDPNGDGTGLARSVARPPKYSGDTLLDASLIRPSARPAMHHFGLKTANLDAMAEWYAKVLGMSANHRSSKLSPGTSDSRCTAVWLSNDDANHRIKIMALPGLADDVQRSRHKGLHHIAFEYPSLDDLLATFGRLKLFGIEPVRAADHGATTSFYYEDPDGNTIELLVDNFGDGRLSSEFMRTSAKFASNPLGADVDPEQIFAARAAGMTLAEIHERAYRGEFYSAAGFYRHFLEAAAQRNSTR